jgi:hypothetical protein
VPPTHVHRPGVARRGAGTFRPRSSPAAWCHPTGTSCTYARRYKKAAPALPCPSPPFPLGRPSTQAHPSSLEPPDLAAEPPPTHPLGDLRCAAIFLSLELCLIFPFPSSSCRTSPPLPPAIRLRRCLGRPSRRRLHPPSPSTRLSSEPLPPPPCSVPPPSSLRARGETLPPANSHPVVDERATASSRTCTGHGDRTVSTPRVRTPMLAHGPPS